MPFSAMQDNENTTKRVSAYKISACSFMGGVNSAFLISLSTGGACAPCVRKLRLLYIR